jgi:hypothetical protein
MLCNRKNVIDPFIVGVLDPFHAPLIPVSLASTRTEGTGHSSDQFKGTMRNAEQQ